MICWESHTQMFSLRALFARVMLRFVEWLSGDQSIPTPF